MSQRKPRKSLDGGVEYLHGACPDADVTVTDDDGTLCLCIDEYRLDLTKLIKMLDRLGLDLVD